MAEQGVGNTALGAAVCRLIEQYQPPTTRLLNDPVVEHLVGAPIRLMVRFAAMRNFILKQTDATMQGIYGTQICRACYDDDAVQAALAKGIDQMVILGAGLDTRPYRLPGITQVKVFEVDLPTVQADKKKKLQKQFGRLPEHVTYLPIDFSTQSLEARFDGTAFNFTKPAVFVWEGVTQYLDEESVERTLTFVGNAAAGSIIVFTYVLQSIIERRSGIAGADKMLDWVAKNNAPWRFGLEPAALADYLQPFHMTLLADVGNAEYQEKYLRPLGRQLTVTEAERVAHAVVTTP